ncbi:MAG: VCBS repeat-containing protein [Gammaproteobacteria bacterium]|nr:VCBS repeat-containing protein [Gammaproteobacteria bacterium]
MRHLLRSALGGALSLPLLAACGGDDSRTRFPPAEVQYGLVSTDLNGDGFADIIATTMRVSDAGPPFTAELRAYRHPGAVGGGFGAPATYPDGYEPWFLAVGDIDGDTLPDIVSASVADGGLAIFYNDPARPGTLGPRQLLASPGASQLAIADLNADGRADIVAADYGVSLFVQDPAAPGRFQAPLGLHAGGANWVAVGDLNGDGLADISVTDARGVQLFFHATDAASTAFQAPVSVHVQTPNAYFLGANAVAIADVNGDGRNDLVITDPGPTGGSAPFVAVLAQDAINPGRFLAAVEYPIASHNLGQCVLVADVSGDGLPDIVVGGSDAVSVLQQDAGSPGRYLAAQNYATPLGAYQLALADLDGNALPDIVVTNGATTPTVNGVITTHPGVLYHDAANPGTFQALQDLP